MSTVSKRVGFTCSTFDLFHAGHILMLEEAKRQCDYLIVGLQTDPTIDRPQKNKPVQSVFERFCQVRGCKFVDEIVVYETEADLMNLLQSYPIDVRILGEEYEGKDFTGHLVPMEFYFNRRRHTFSSSGLRQRVFSEELQKNEALVRKEWDCPVVLTESEFKEVDPT
jgi:glycerol-3-phosphate cytidylyltransferase